MSKAGLRNHIFSMDIASRALFTSVSESKAQRVDIWRRSLPAFMFKERIVAKDGFNRWLVPPAAIATHMSIVS